MVIVIGQEPFNMTMMTANSGGSLGKVNGKPVVFSILSPDQPYEQMEKAESYTIRFYPTGQTEPTVILECKKLPSPATMYEIVVRVSADKIVYDGRNSDSEQEKVMNYLMKAYWCSFSDMENVILLKNDVEIQICDILNIRPFDMWR